MAEPSTDVAIGPSSVLRLHRLAVRDSDDDPDEVVVGRAETGAFVELPRIGAIAISLLDTGSTVGEVEERIAREHDVELDVVEFAEALVELEFVSGVDGRSLSGGAQRREHLPWLRERHVRWLFGRTANVVWLGVLLAAAVTWWQRPDLVPSASDFYWTPYVGLAVLVNTALFSVSATVHELMHLAAARSYGAPARIGFSTRLHYLVVQTDVTAIWAVPRRARLRVYLAGMKWDAFLVTGCVLVVAHAGLPVGVDRVLAALALVVLLSMAVQVQVYMRTDLYYVLMEWLRGRNVFQDALAYLRHLVRRGPDPTADLPARERRAVRVYAVAMAVGSAISLSVFALYGLPIVITGVVGAFTGLLGGIGDPWRVVDSALVIAVECVLQTAFLIAFHRGHRHWFTRRRG
ncbi:hypothetical protein B0I31_111113 [Saccharothrix carnea]|uniref:Peptide zinc metalloprotease protein n=1 Tax=Saccharothrix carnea TaxID=1280637 RepID=A0A2P8I2Y3_SACCR|nr:PqqD family protein [Saccharothrix carnea]PSL52826.1 hypothetical protein B0I31_111113 [Saccharothrix carnea]